MLWQSLHSGPEVSGNNGSFWKKPLETKNHNRDCNLDSFFVWRIYFRESFFQRSFPGMDIFWGGFHMPLPNWISRGIDKLFRCFYIYSLLFTGAKLYPFYLSYIFCLFVISCSPRSNVCWWNFLIVHLFILHRWRVKTTHAHRPIIYYISSAHYVIHTLHWSWPTQLSSLGLKLFIRQICLCPRQFFQCQPLTSFPLSHFLFCEIIILNYSHK